MLSKDQSYLLAVKIPKMHEQPTDGEMLRDLRPDGHELHRGFATWIANRTAALADPYRRVVLFAEWSRPVLEQIATEVDGDMDLFIALAAERLPWAVYADELPDPLSRWMTAAVIVRETTGQPVEFYRH